MSYALALIAASTGPVAQIPEIRLDSRTIHAGDLAEIPGRELVILGTLPRGEQRVELEPEQARRLVANRLPGARFTLRHSGKVALTGPASEGRKGTVCFLARTEIPAGSVILATDIAEADCDGRKASQGIGYDHQRSVPFARGPIATGAFLGPLRAARSEPVSKGKILTFRTTEGPVIVEREVEALQTGRPGRKIFVRTKSGEVIAAPLATAPQETSE